MARPKKRKIQFNLNLNNYFYLIFLSIRKPKEYLQAMPVKDPDLSKPLVFFIFNLSLGLLAGSIIEIVSNLTVNLIFLSISRIVFSIPFALMGLFFSSLILYLIARTLGGKGSWRESLKALAYSSTPAIFYSLPLVGLLALAWQIYLLVYFFQTVHHYSFVRSFINIIIPVSLLAIFLILLGLINFLEVIKLF